jgi:hypothetical protein
MEEYRITELDCESIESIYATLAYSSCIDEQVLQNFIAEISAEHCPPWDSSITPEEYLYQEFEKRITVRCSSLTHVYGYHMTAMPESYASYSDGLLPLNDALPKLWNILQSLLPDIKSEIEDVRLNSKELQQKLKNRADEQQGPFGVLINPLISRQENKTFWKLPEIIEDIFNCFEDSRAAKYKLIQSFQSFVVKFRKPVSSTGNDRQIYVGNALRFLCNEKSNWEGEDFVTTTVSCEGRPIPETDIIYRKIVCPH